MLKGYDELEDVLAAKRVQLEVVEWEEVPAPWARTTIAGGS